MSQVTPKSVVEAIEKELNWGAEKLWTHHLYGN